MAITEVAHNYTGAEKAAVPTPDKQGNTDKVSKSTKEYSDYLSSKYGCLQGEKGRSVTIAPDLLSKAATDIKTSQWLEENLKLIPDVMNKIHQNAAQNGARVVSCNISFDGYDSMTTQVHTISEYESGADEMKKTLEEIRTKSKEQKKQQLELQQKKENLQAQRITTNNADSLLDKLARIDFTKGNHAGRVFIDCRI